MNTDVVIDRQDLPEGATREGGTVHDKLRSSACADLLLQQTEVAGLRQLHGKRVAHRKGRKSRDNASPGERGVPTSELPEILGVVHYGESVAPGPSRGNLKGVVGLPQIVT